MLRGHAQSVEGGGWDGVGAGGVLGLCAEEMENKCQIPSICADGGI